MGKSRAMMIYNCRHSLIRCMHGDPAMHACMHADADRIALHGVLHNYNMYTAKYIVFYHLQNDRSIN